jgi:hypothetical protein
MQIARTNSLASTGVSTFCCYTHLSCPPPPTEKGVGVEIRVVKIIDYHHDRHTANGSDYNTSYCTAKFCSCNSQPRTWSLINKGFKDDPRTYHPYHAPPHAAILVTPKDLNWLHNGLISGNFKVILDSEWTYRQRYLLRFSCINRYAVDMRSLDRTCFPCRTISLSGIR